MGKVKNNKMIPALLLSTIFVSPFTMSAQAQEVDLSPRIEALNIEHISLESKTNTLLLLLAKEREKLLKEMKGDVLKRLEEWDENPDFMNGMGLRAALATAYEIAEHHGLDVERLKKLLALSSKTIRGFDYHIACGTTSTTLGQMAEGIKDSSDVGKRTMQYYGAVAVEEERIACVTERRLTTYRAMYRNFLRALITQDSQKSDPTGDKGHGFKESAKGFRDFADTLQTISGIEAEQLAQEAIAMAEDQDNVMMFFEMVPGVGEMLDIYKLTAGESVLGTKVSAMEKAMTAGFLFTPKFLTLWIKRCPTCVGTMRETLNSVKWGYFDAAYINKAGTNASTALGNSLGSIKKWADDSLKKLDDAAKKNPPDSTVNARPARKVPGEHPATAIRKSLEEGGIIKVSKGDYFRMGEEANMMPEHALALSENAMKRQEVYLVRHLSENALNAYRAAYKAATEATALLREIATKPMSVKPKSSDYAILEAGIPIDQYLSKTNELLEDAVGEAAEKLNAEILQKNMYMNGGVEEIIDAAGNKTFKRHEPLVAPPGASAEEMANYPFRRTVAQYDGHEVLWKTVDGKRVLGYSKDGKLFDPFTKATYSLDGTTTVEILSSEANIKILPDFDLMGVFSTARGMEMTWDNAGNFVDHVMTSTLGAIDRVALDALTAINARVKSLMKVGGDVVHHGPAHFFTAPPDYPLDVFLKDGSYMKVMAGPASDPDRHLKALYHSFQREGIKVPNPPVEWGWPPYDPYTGFRGAGQ